MLRQEASLTYTVLTPPDLDIADGENIRVAPQRGAENDNAQLMEFDELLKSPFAITMPLVRDVLSSRATLRDETHGEEDLARLSAGSRLGPPACLPSAEAPQPAVHACLQMSVCIAVEAADER